jgi:hypothetical protein
MMVEKSGCTSSNNRMIKKERGWLGKFFERTSMKEKKRAKGMT